MLHMATHTLVCHRGCPNALKMQYRSYNYNSQQSHWQHKFAPSVYKIDLNRAIKRNAPQNVNEVMQILVDDYMYHLVWCMMNNNEINTIKLESWVHQQYDELNVAFSFHSIPGIAIKEVASFLTDQEECKMRQVCKFTNYLLEPGLCCFGFDAEYNKLCGLARSNQDLKQAVLDNVKQEHLIKFLVKDVRAITVTTAKHLTTKLNEAPLVQDEMKTPPRSHSLHERALNDDFLMQITQMLDQQSYFHLTRICLRWLRSIGSSRVLSRLTWNKQVIFNIKKFKRWSTTGSTWFAVSGAPVFQYLVSKKETSMYHPTHVSRFVGHGLRFYVGTSIVFDWTQCYLSNLDYIGLQPTQATSTIERIDHRWYGFAKFVQTADDCYPRYWNISKSNFEYFDVLIPSECLILNKCKIDVVALSTLIQRYPFSHCVLWKCQIDNPCYDDFENYMAQEDKTHIIINDCDGSAELLDWTSMGEFVNKITFMRRYECLTFEDMNFLNKLIFITGDRRDTLSILFWESPKNSMWRYNDENDGMTYFWEMIHSNWIHKKKQIKWNHIKVGLHVQQMNEEKDHFVDLVQQCQTNHDLKQCDKEWNKMLRLQWNASPELDSVMLMIKYWNTILQEWYILPC